jgi:hypothetical protein
VIQKEEPIYRWFFFLSTAARRSATLRWMIAAALLNWPKKPLLRNWARSFNRA